METVDASHMRAMNCSILLKLIWKHHRISRADISRMTRMSRSTVSAIVAELMDRGLVKELGNGPSNGGRRPMMLAFQEDAYTILGLQVSAHSIAAATINLNGVVRSWKIQACDVLGAPAEAFELVQKMIADSAATSFRENMPLIGMALAHPSLVDRKEAINFASWESALRSVLPIPVHFDSDANFGALAELWWNQSEQPRHLGFFQLDETLSFGLMMRSQDQQYSFGVSSSLGHLLLAAPKGVQTLHQQMSRASCKKNSKFSTLSEIFEAAQCGDVDAEQWLEQAASPLALTLYNTQALLQLDRIVIGGLWRQETGRLIAAIESLEAVHGQASAMPLTNWLVPSFRGDQQIALGAGTRVLERVLEDLSLFPARCYVETIPCSGSTGEISLSME